MSSSVLNVDQLSVAYDGRKGSHPAVSGVSLHIGEGEALGLVGESGSGKSSVALAILRYLPKNARIAASALEFQGREIRDLSAEQLRRLRGNHIAAVYQHPGAALNPSMTIGRQITETVMRHRPVRLEEARGRAAELLGRVRVSHPERVLDLYPHELSGGMQQRANIAIAIALDPSLLVLDEPTTALDASVQSEIIAILSDLRKDHKTSILLISHDINMIRRSCDRVAVMQAGTVVESGVASDVFDNPSHAYTKALIASIPALNYTKRDGRLAETDGVPAHPMAQGEDAGLPKERRIAIACKGISHAFGSQPVLHHVDLDIGQGETFGLIGESGSGKSTLARIVTGLQTPSAGSVELFGRTVAPRVEKRNLAERRDVQMVFQSPDRTLNPRQRIGTILGRPLRRLAGLRRSEVRARVGDLLQSVRLAGATAEQKSRSLSGGQRQRAAIARAFAGVPKVVVLDEPTSALDVSVQATVLNLLNDLQRDKDTTYLFISHDLRVVRYMADRIGVLYRGRLVETGSSDQIFRGPNHPYTALLLAASSDEAAPRLSAPIEIEAAGVPNTGCSFADRCPLVLPDCRKAEPPAREVAAGHRIACWRHRQGF
ncbi:ABC transporter ATP-binding protein [Mesorhizobium sp. M7A.F.Ca.US.014.04.1.1]|nr:MULTISPECIES: ABC transporter ATP-binding protein [Mesorhizobium]AMX94166.1 peptide ABC transporter ATP-binding protein [Mesorhizobium ciceri]MDF3208931.1 ABC transporter ATP-binding protein [Mesorhizobium sp. LMG15046]MDF3228497.1 ABC transporter ATP-binding protein [Mesorhizobium sp. DSM 30133]RUU20074.1 ABC transporter ATP-binding protein [Mesorhizobium sp. Primo-B]RUU36648.1 ABC transporter ATP-binding protein [Mesorhizobium sp. Primo-A]